MATGDGDALASNLLSSSKSHIENRSGYSTKKQGLNGRHKTLELTKIAHKNLVRCLAFGITNNGHALQCDPDLHNCAGQGRTNAPVPSCRC